MPITRFLSEPTLRFFMFFLLDKHVDIGYIDQWNLPKNTANWRGPFKLTDIANDDREAEELLQDLEDYGLNRIARTSTKEGEILNCPEAYRLVHMNWRWRDRAIIIAEASTFKKEWEGYIAAFKNNKLSSIHNYYQFENHKTKMLEIFSQYYLQFRGPTFSIKVKPDHCRYFEFLWVLQQDGICIINDIQCQDKKVLEQTDMPVGSVLNITLTEKGMKKLQSFIEKHPQKMAEEQTVEGKIWQSQHAWKDWVVNREGAEIRYKNVLVDFKRARKAYKLVQLLIESNKGEISRAEAIRNLGYTTNGKKVNSVGDTITDDEELIRSKINDLGRTIHKKVLDACKKEGKEVNFYISVVGEVVKIHPNSF